MNKSKHKTIIQYDKLTDKLSFKSKFIKCRRTNSRKGFNPPDTATTIISNAWNAPVEYPIYIYMDVFFLQYNHEEETIRWLLIQEYLALPNLNLCPDISSYGPKHHRKMNKSRNCSVRNIFLFGHNHPHTWLIFFIISVKYSTSVF